MVGNVASGDATTAAGLGDAITWAVDHGADVLNISVVVGTDDRTLRTAVARAIDKGVVVVASVGNSHSDSGPDPTPYPADYPGVIGVGSIDSTGERSSTSEVGDFLDVVAPGGGVTADRVPSGLGAFDGTSFAVPYVAATAALIRQEFPGLGPDQVAARIFATTDRPPIGASPDRLRSWDRRSVPSGRRSAARHRCHRAATPSTTSPPHVAGGPVTGAGSRDRESGAATVDRRRDRRHRTDHAGFRLDAHRRPPASTRPTVIVACRTDGSEHGTRRQRASEHAERPNMTEAARKRASRAPDGHSVITPMCNSPSACRSSP